MRPVARYMIAHFNSDAVSEVQSKPRLNDARRDRVSGAGKNLWLYRIWQNLQYSGHPSIPGSSIFQEIYRLQKDRSERRHPFSTPLSQPRGLSETNGVPTSTVGAAVDPYRAGWRTAQKGAISASLEVR